MPAADKAADSTVVLPKEEILGRHDIFLQLRDEKMPAVKTLAEAGLTKVVVVYIDRQGKMRTQVNLVSYEVQENILSLLDNEHIG